MMRVAWANRRSRSSVVRRLVPPLLLVGLIATVGVLDIVGTIVRTRHDPTTLTLQIDDGRKGHKDHDEDGDEDDKKGDQVNGEAIAQAAKDAKEKGGSVFDISAAALEATQAQMATAAANASAAKASAPPAPPPPSGLAAALHAVWEFLTSKVAKLIATLSIVEWILVSIGREHQDQIAYETSVLTGVPATLPRPPRLRFDLAWLKMKGWRTLRLFIFLALAGPVMWLVGTIPRVGGSLALWSRGWWRPTGRACSPSPTRSSSGSTPRPRSARRGSCASSGGSRAYRFSGSRSGSTRGSSGSRRGRCGRRASRSRTHRGNRRGSRSPEPSRACPRLHRHAPRVHARGHARLRRAHERRR